ncbi:MAG: energy-coupling factor transporter ATPase [Eggerthellaceae bacterium]|nr:energy-coupling factor transporter ATPase [Eggerthellaceae bacterium]
MADRAVGQGAGHADCQAAGGGAEGAAEQLTEEAARQPAEQAAEGTAEAPFVACEAMGFGYGDGALVFDGFDLTVPQGQYLCLLGGNGSGKSTLAKLIDALLVPQAGAVRVFGRRTDEPANLFFVRSNTGLVFQSPDDQLVASLVENDVAFGPENLGVPAPELRQRVEAALAEVGLQGFERSEVHSLSGGQKQRVAIAGALALEPALLVLDEATAMLDPRGRASLRRVARQLHAQGMTVISITHFMEEAVDAQRVVVLDQGRVRLDGTPAEVFARGDELRSLDLDVPFVAELAGQLRDLGVAAPAALTDGELADALEALRQGQPSQGDGAEGGREAPAGGTATAAAAMAAAAGDAKAAGMTAMATAATATTATAGAAAAPPAGAPVLLSYEGVGFSYGRKAKSKRRCEGKAAAARSADPASARAWGAEPNAAQALHDVAFEVREGGFLGLAGHTGSGKSTLIQTMNGLLRATEGTVRFRGANLADKAAAAQARTRIGVVFQYPEAQLFAPTVYDDVAFGPRNLGLDAATVDGRVRDALEAVRLPYEAVHARSPFELSGGQQRRAALAGVLAMDPQVLVLDEPAAGLDPRGRRSFLELLKRLHGQGMTMVMASHSMEDLAQLCDYLLVLEGGTIARRGTPAQVFADAGGLHGLGLAPPAPMAFASALRERGFALPHGLYDTPTLAGAIAAALQG